MKKVRPISFIVLSIALSLVLAACSSTTNLSQIEGAKVEGAEFEEELLTFEELILRSDVAIVGEYVGMIEHESYIEKKFKVKECLYGDVTDSEIYLYSNIGTGHITEIDYTYEYGADVYEVGMDYILIMEKNQSVMYDHDRYMLAADVFLCENNNEYSLYSQSIDIPTETAVKEFICSIYNSVSHPAVVNVPVSYENEIQEMVGESEYVGTVRILELVNEGKVHNGNVYRCTVESLSKGSNLNTYDDGTILIVILKNTVEIDNNYIIGFSPVDEGSLIYTQSTDTSVYNVSNELLSEISQSVSD